MTCTASLIDLFTIIFIEFPLLKIQFWIVKCIQKGRCLINKNNVFMKVIWQNLLKPLRAYRWSHFYRWIKLYTKVTWQFLGLSFDGKFFVYVFHFELQLQFKPVSTSVNVLKDEMMEMFWLLCISYVTARKTCVSLSQNVNKIQDLRD